MLIFQMIRAVYASVDTIVGQIQWCKQHDTVSVIILFDLLRQLIDLIDLLLILTCQKYGSLAVGQTFALLCLGDDGIHHLHIVLVGIRKCQCFHDFLVRDKLLCL